MDDFFTKGQKPGGKSQISVSIDGPDLCISNLPGRCWTPSSLTIQLSDIIDVVREGCDTSGFNEIAAASTSYQRLPHESDENPAFAKRGEKKSVGFPQLTIRFVARNVGKHHVWRPKEIVLRHQDAEAIQKLYKQILKVFEPFRVNRPKKLLVIINPYGGKGHAVQIFKKKSKPLLDLAGITCDVIKTERANHGFELVQTYPLDQVDGIASVGGDGMFNELFNGLIRRSAQEHGLDVNDPNTKLQRPGVRLGIIPGGSTDSVVLGLHGTTDVITATLHIILGDSKCIDVASIFTGNSLARYSMTMASYGYFGDLIKFSEGHRWMGPKRYDLAGAITLMKNKSYRGTITLVKDANPLSDPLVSDECTPSCQICSSTSRELVENRDKVTLTIRGKFMAVTAAHITCRSHHTRDGVSIGAHLGDGNTDLILVKKTSRFNFYRYLFRTAYHRANPFKLPYVEVHRVRQFSFRAMQTDGDVAEDCGKLDVDDEKDLMPVVEDSRVKRSLWNVDGEILDHGNIFVKVHCRLVPVFSRGPIPSHPEKMRDSEEDELNKTSTVTTLIIDETN